MFRSFRCLAAAAVLWLVPGSGIAHACKCVPPGQVCQDRAALVFIGTVSEAGPSWADFDAELAKRLSREQLEKFERGDDLTSTEIKELLAKLLPWWASTEVSQVETVDDAGRLLVKYNPALKEEMRQVRFRVDETLRGSDATSREVWTGRGRGDCGFEFRAGGRYLVYASPDPETGRFETGICQRTREFSTGSHDEELEYLRSVRRGETKGSIFGYAISDPQDVIRFGLTGAEPRRPLAGAVVRIESGTFSREVLTDAKGAFAFSYLPSGDYALGMAAPDGQFAKTPRRVQLESNRCVMEILH